MITIKRGFFSIGFSVAIVTWFSQCRIWSNKPQYIQHKSNKLFSQSSAALCVCVAILCIKAQHTLHMLLPWNTNVCNSVSIDWFVVTGWWGGTVCGGLGIWTSFPHTQLATTQQTTAAQSLIKASLTQSQQKTWLKIKHVFFYERYCIALEYVTLHYPRLYIYWSQRWVIMSVKKYFLCSITLQTEQHILYKDMRHNRTLYKTLISTTILQDPWWVTVLRLQP